jgi:acetate kinase
MSDGILVLNAGSSSIKFSLYTLVDGSPCLASKGQIEGIGVAPHFVAKSLDGQLLEERRWGKEADFHALLEVLLDWIEHHLGDVELRVIGHRVVHGGVRYRHPVLIDDTVRAELRHLIPLAPLHQPHNIEVIDTIAALEPDVPQVACFDTAFHRDNDPLATLFALPRPLIEEGVRRYGFHGLSYEFISRRLRALAPSAAAGKVVVCHLGSGASMCAIDNGRSVASTMGFTALDGLPMGTRTGQLDCGVVLYLLQEKGMSAGEIEHLLYKESGLLGLSGISNDMRVLVESEDPGAREAVDYFIYRITRELGSLAAAMGGLDALVFTAGIGEHSPEVRARVLQATEWLGLDVDERANRTAGEGRISSEGARCSAWVIPTDEELMIALHSQEILASLRQPMVVPG